MDVTEDINKIVHIAQSLASENSNPTYGPAHVLRAILHKDFSLTSVLNNFDVDVYFIEEWADVRLESYPKGKIGQTPIGDKLIEHVFNEAENIALKLGIEKFDSVCIFISLCTAGVGFTHEQLKTFPVTPQQILEKIQALNGFQNTSGLKNKQSNLGAISSSSGILMKYCFDLVAKVKSKEADIFIGGEQELVTISEILCRHTKTNIILTGAAGVGKTALVRGFAQFIADGKVPEKLVNATLFELDFSALMAGAGYKGEIEDRFRNILNDLSNFELPILFIDDIHILFDKTQSFQGIVNLLRSFLSRKAFTLICTTLSEEYSKKIEPDISFTRWCEVMNVNEPSEEQAAIIVQGISDPLMKHHGVIINSIVIAEAVKLSKRYIKERKLPDTVIDVLDRSMAALKMMYHMGKKLSARFAEEFELLKNNSDGVIDYPAFYKNMISRQNYLTIAYVEGDTLSDNKPVTALNIEHVIEKLNTLEESGTLTLDIEHVAATISKLSGIPAGKIMAGERERLVNMEKHICNKVIGQDQAVKVMTDAILESRSGLSRPGQPIGSFFLLGPTGTGKTELAKQLADFLFQSSAALIRFDMSEFKEEHSAALLYGAPPGYVGYEEGGLLVNKIKQQPYSVVLFDEIEKAHTSVFDIFLQILDEGKIHDKLGRIGDFSNAVILFTSNIGSQVIIDSFNKNKTLPSQNELTKIMSRFFRPEFLGRLSGIVPFAPITVENVVRILKLQLLELETALLNQGINFSISEEAAHKLATEGYTPEYGARPLRMVIRSQLKTPLSHMIIGGKLAFGDSISVVLDVDKKLKLECTNSITF